MSMASETSDLTHNLIYFLSIYMYSMKIKKNYICLYKKKNAYDILIKINKLNHNEKKTLVDINK